MIVVHRHSIVILTISITDGFVGNYFSQDFP